MKILGLHAKASNRFRICTDSKHTAPIAEDKVKRNFDISSPNRVWASDVTYLWTKEGWLYLAVTLDLFSRRVVGWSMGDRLTAKLAVDALETALNYREIGKNLIHHSDRGKEYASSEFREVLAKNNVQQSMSRKANCWDNAVLESFFHTLKTEMAVVFPTRVEAKAAVFEWIEVFYNRRRLHSTLGYVSPAVYEEKLVA